MHFMSTLYYTTFFDFFAHTTHDLFWFILAFTTYVDVLVYTNMLHTVDLLCSHCYYLVQWRFIYT